MRRLLIWGGATAALLSGAAQAQQADTAGATVPARGDPAGAAERHDDIVVTARRLDAARASIQPSLGATAYLIDNATIHALPGGDNQQFNEIVLQLPGVVQDGFGQFHVRDDHSNLQYRINGTILPEGIAVFGQTLSPRLIEKFSLLTGALPAQYGLRTGGILDITTKSGLKNGGSVSLYGGSHGTIEPSIDYGGSTGSTNYFVSGSFDHNKLGIESVDGSSTPLHDTTNQGQLFGYADHIFDDHNRVSLVAGYSNQHFQIPNPRGLHADGPDGLGYNVNGVTDFLSNDLDERQVEQTGFGQLAWLHDSGKVTIQSALFARSSSLDYTPDVLGELLFNGQAQRAVKHDLALGAQLDVAWRAGNAHTIRFGGVISRDRSTSRTLTTVFPVDDSFPVGDPRHQTGQPFAIADNGGKTQWTYSAYLQDEWKILPRVTVNLGARFDYYKGFRAEHQLSPRANLVWQPTGRTTIHLGYARYFSPPPFELVAGKTVALFNGTSAAAPTTLDTTPFAERQQYFDVGFQQKIGSSLTFGVDGYYRRSHNLVDEGQFGAPIVLTPFNYRRGKIRGIEANASYARGLWLIYANFAYAQAKGKDIVSSQFNFDPAELDYIRTHYIFLDHDQTYTGSAGISYAFRQGPLAGLKLGSDMIYGSGLRTEGAGGVPNGGKLKSYAQVNLSASYRIAGPGIEVRLDVINLADHKYLIRDGAGVGVGAPQFGPRRGIFVGLSKDI
jgi:outer membrane receptor for ferrienterochelin and colicins